MSVVVILTLKAKDESWDQLKSTLQAILPDTAAYEGAELIRAAADEATKTCTVYEVWDKIESQKAYLAWRDGRGELAALGQMLREPPDFAERAHLF